jgi:hypothetical protein
MSLRSSRRIILDKIWITCVRVFKTAFCFVPLRIFNNEWKFKKQLRIWKKQSDILYILIMSQTMSSFFHYPSQQRILLDLRKKMPKKCRLHNVTKGVITSHVENLGYLPTLYLDIGTILLGTDLWRRQVAVFNVHPNTLGLWNQINILVPKS